MLSFCSAEYEISVEDKQSDGGSKKIKTGEKNECVASRSGCPDSDFMARCLSRCNPRVTPCFCESVCGLEWTALSWGTFVLIIRRCDKQQTVLCFLVHYFCSSLSGSRIILVFQTSLFLIRSSCELGVCCRRPELHQLTRLNNKGAASLFYLKMFSNIIDCFRSNHSTSMYIHMYTCVCFSVHQWGIPTRASCGQQDSRKSFITLLRHHWGQTLWCLSLSSHSCILRLSCRWHMMVSWNI